MFKNSRLISAIFLILLTSVSRLAYPAPTSANPNFNLGNGFKVFDATQYLHKPDLAKHGIRPIKIVYHADLWNDDQDDSKIPDPIRVKDAVRQLSADDPIAVIDIEHWPVTQTDGRIHPENLDKLLHVIALFRKFSPTSTIGYYGIPLPDYWRAINGRGKVEAPHWQAENDRLAPVVEAQDAIFPSIYTFYADREAWVKYAIAQIKEARRIAKGKPVYVFLWPQYHESNAILGMEYLKPDYWKLELETAGKYADGIIIWGGSRQEWDEEADWWKVTLDFMKSLK